MNLSTSEPGLAPAIVNGKYDHLRMREAIAHWILMHEHSFSIVDEAGFDFMMKVGIPQWPGLCRTAAKNDCLRVYENQKTKLKEMLKKVDSISLTTDMWKSKCQKIGYMVITGHFLDKDWKLNKWVLNFVHVPPPHRGIDISDALYKCFQEWDIEKKVYSISMDNASSNDNAIKNLRRIFEVDRKLLCDGRLFHVRCCAHILNLIAQDGLETIKLVIKNVRESVSFINASEARTKTFNDLAQQMKLPNKKLILDCKTRWNSTYEMLSGAYTFKEVIPKYEERDLDYESCPSTDDWVKQVLDSKKDDENEFNREMVKKMKDKFDKYWKEVHLLMAIAAVLDPRVKMWSLEFCFPKIYKPEDAKDLVEMVEKTLRSLHSEYVTIYNQSTNQSSEQNGSFMSESSKAQSKTSSGSGFQELQNFVRQNEAAPMQKSDLDVYFEDGCHMCAPEDNKHFNILDWWKSHESKYRILSKLERDILAIPIATVASEATFSAGSRVIDKHRASLGVETVQALLCGGSWIRNIHGVKKKNQGTKVPTVINPN